MNGFVGIEQAGVVVRREPGCRIDVCRRADEAGDGDEENTTERCRINPGENSRGRYPDDYQNADRIRKVKKSVPEQKAGNEGEGKGDEGVVHRQCGMRNAECGVKSTRYIPYFYHESCIR